MAGRPMLVRAINQMDNPGQAKYKEITHAWFQPRQVRHLEERIGKLARASELTGEPAWTETSFVGGLKRLPIRFRSVH